MQLELFSMSELCVCATKTSLKAFKSFDFELADKMLSACDSFKFLQKELFQVTHGRPYWQR